MKLRLRKAEPPPVRPEPECVHIRRIVCFDANGQEVYNLQTSAIMFAGDTYSFHIRAERIPE